MLRFSEKGIWNEFYLVNRWQGLIIDFLTLFFRTMFWVSDTHAVLGGFLCFFTAVGALVALYLESLLIAIPLTAVLFVYVLMIMIYCDMSCWERQSLKWSVEDYVNGTE